MSVTSNQRLYDIIQSVGGFHRDADESKITIIDSADGASKTYSLKYYNQIYDNKNNPLIYYGNIITVPFMNINDKIISTLLMYSILYIEMRKSFRIFFNLPKILIQKLDDTVNIIFF